MEQVGNVEVALVVLVAAVAFMAVALGAACLGVVWLCWRMLTKYQASWGSAMAFVARQAQAQDQTAYGNMAAVDATAAGVGELSVGVREGERGRVPRPPQPAVVPAVDDPSDLQ